MFKWFSNLIDSNEREINRLKPGVAAVNGCETDMQAMTTEDLGQVTVELRQQLAEGDSLDDLLPEAFAAVREAARRTIGQRHYDVQLMGGMILHQGKIAEMKTGEGKTLVATLPAYLNALSGQGVHLVTVNDYLAKRDTQWMGGIYHLLGMSVACIQHDTSFMFDPEYKLEDPRYTHLRPVSRREAYLADITYGTNTEFGFDYLRDNMVVDLGQMSQRELHYAIVDEVDNILIDEAKTPLIISGQSRSALEEEYRRFAQFGKRLTPGQDYTIDEKQRSVSITEDGIDRLERWLGIANMYSDENSRYTHFVENALKAEVIFKRDQDYMVKDGEIIIVDEFTGRQMPGRRWSDGLHQAIEAKEGLRIQHENLTLATVTLQNYFRLYAKLAGMTGTALTEAEELHKIYKLDVVVVPTHRDMIRKDLGDLVYKNEKGKFEAVVQEIVEGHKTGQPLLVGTVTIETSEHVSELLRRQGVPHEVLNAKFHEREAEVVAQAGRFGAVTIATNMAGRGTDILLGGNPEGLALTEALRRHIAPDESPDEYRVILAEMRRRCAEEREKVLAAGGLHIIGTDRHEARRIDNQLRGRSGRQGDPGSSRFYVSLEDDIMRRFGGDRIKGFMEWAGIEDDVPIEHGLVSKSIETAQSKVESYNFDIRKHLVEYDDVMNAQRNLIYAERRKILSGADLRSNVMQMVHDELTELLSNYLAGTHEDEWELEGLISELGHIFPPSADLTPDALALMSRGEIEERVQEYADLVYEAREQELSPEMCRVLERLVMLDAIDRLWVEHLTRVEDMRQGIGLRAYGQSDPLVAYKREAYDMYNELREQIRQNIARGIYRANLVRQPVPQAAQGGGAAVPLLPQAAPRPQPTRTNRDPLPSGNGRAAARTTTAKRVGRNDPCPCGSGKKYKRCHGVAA